MMEFIVSDTNVWIDFILVDKLNVPFKASYIYLMSSDAANEELLSPQGLKDSLLSLGLQLTELDDNEFDFAMECAERYFKLSIHDRAALAIAKNRKLTLLTGDMALRKAAEMENVPVMGTIGLLDRLLNESFLTADEYEAVLNDLQKLNGGKIRLPASALKLRLALIRERLK